MFVIFVNNERSSTSTYTYVESVCLLTLSLLSVAFSLMDSSEGSIFVDFLFRFKVDLCTVSTVYSCLHRKIA